MENIEEMTCPICGNKFNTLDSVIDDAGNPICPKCADDKEKNNNYK